jgi:hypothetical protein
MWYEIQVAIGKAAFDKKKKTYHQQIELKFRDETSEVLHLEYSFVCCWYIDTLEIRSEIL